MKEVVIGSSVAMVLKVLGSGMTLGLNVLIARTMGAADAGIFFLSLTVVTIAGKVGELGMRNTLLRFTAAGSSVDDWGAVKGVYRKGVGMASAFSILLALTCFALMPWLAKTVFSKPELAQPLRWMSLAIVPIVLFSLYSNLLKGLMKIFSSQLVFVVCLPSFGIPAVYVLGKLWGVMGAVWGYNIAAFFTALIGFLLWHSATPHLRTKTGAFDMRKLVKTSTPLFIIDIMFMTITWLSSLLLGVWRTNAEVGIFNAALRTSQITAIFLVAINSIAAPKYARLYQQGHTEALASTALNSTKMVLLFTSPILLLFFLVPEWVMEIFGDQFRVGAKALLILTLGQFINAATGSVSPLLVMTGHEGAYRNSFTFGALVSIVLNVVLVPRIGIIGAALATAAGIAGKNAYAAYQIWVHLGINTVPFDWLGLKWLKQRFSLPDKL